MSRRFETPASVVLERSDEAFHAHVEIDVAIRPGDRVRLHGAPIALGQGERARLTRLATVERAPLLARLWQRFAGHFALLHLYEVSFSGRRVP